MIMQSRADGNTFSRIPGPASGSAALLARPEPLAQGQPGHREQDGDRQRDQPSYLAGEPRLDEGDGRGAGDLPASALAARCLTPRRRAGRGRRVDRGEQAGGVSGADELAGYAVEVRDG